jgi:hypothetical protein
MHTTKSLLEIKKSCFRNYSIRSKDKIKAVLLALKVVYMKGKTGKKGSKTLGYVVFGVSWTIEKNSPGMQDPVRY